MATLRNVNFNNAVLGVTSVNALSTIVAPTAQFDSLQFSKDGPAVTQIATTTLDDVASALPTSSTVKTYVDAADKILSDSIGTVASNLSAASFSVSELSTQLNAFAWKTPVKGFIAAPPGPNVAGDRWILSAPWNSFSANQIITYDGSQFNAETPATGTSLCALDSGIVYLFDGTSWVPSATQMTGFVNNTDSAISYNYATKTLTLTVNSPATSYKYFIQGIMHTISSTLSVTHVAAVATYYVYLDTTEALNISTSSWNETTNTPVAIIGYSNGGSPIDYRKLCTMDFTTFDNLRKYVGPTLLSGAVASSYTIQPSTPTNATNAFTLTSANISLLGSTVSTPTQPTSNYTYMRKNASETWNAYYNCTAPYYPVGGTIAVCSATGSASALADGQFIKTYIIGIPSSSSQQASPVSSFINLMGQTAYNTLEDCQADNFANYDMTNFIYPEYVVLYEVIWGCKNIYTNSGHCRIEAFNRLSGNNVTRLNQLPINHQSLAGLEAVSATNKYGHIQNGTITDSLTIAAAKANQLTVGYDGSHSASFNITTSEVGLQSAMPLHVINSTDSSSTSTGAIIIDGGLGVSKSVNMVSGTATSLIQVGTDANGGTTAIQGTTQLVSSAPLSSATLGASTFNVADSSAKIQLAPASIAVNNSHTWTLYNANGPRWALLKLSLRLFAADQTQALATYTYAISQNTMVSILEDVYLPSASAPNFTVTPSISSGTCSLQVSTADAPLLVCGTAYLEATDATSL